MTTPVPAVVLAAPGTNRDPDACLALRLAGADPTVVLLSELAERPDLLERARLVVVAGGFSFADSLGAGRMMALDLTTRTGDALRRVVDRGAPVIGICNGFQVLTRAGLLPGALGHNDHGRFDCRWVELEPCPASTSVWTRTLTDRIHCPIAHGEGRYVHPDPAALAAAGQVALRYAGTNPNGSVDAIAGVSDTSGLVLGLMPHPENHVVARQHPQAHRCRDGARSRQHTERHTERRTDPHLGLHLFRNGVEWARGAT
jgi:phosphoribosylformylglycinamidine synthase